jgi:hypothetical protein
MTFLFYLLLIVGSPALLFLAVVLLYALFLRTGVKSWFGENTGYRRDRETTRRRRSFENQCLLAAKMLYFTWIAGVAQGIVGDTLPDLSWIFWAVRIALLLVAILFGYGAYVRLTTPDG